MSTAQTWWWIGIGTGLGIVTGTGLILIGRARQNRATPPRQPPSRPPLDTTPPPRKPPTPPLPDPVSVVVRTKSKSGNGTVRADADPQLRYTNHEIPIFKLPADSGTFDLAACVGLRYELDDLTWNSILTPTDDGEERLFLLPDLNLRAVLHIQGQWDGDRILDLELDQKYLGCMGFNVRYPEVGAYFDAKPGTFPSWGGQLPRSPAPGEKWGNGYVPLIGVKIRGDRMFLRIQVPPMVKAHQQRPRRPLDPGKYYTAHEAKYHYEYTAEIEYEVY
ncbi:MAG: hypothetical protein K0U16_07755 [Gammaproteobacteria bacterium]|nr:hypothetical protein [Gammaproteobacteria bacterium]